MAEKTLKEEFAALPPEKCEELAVQIREQFGQSRYAELVQWILDRVQEETVAQIKGYGGGDNERLWNAVGRIQASEMIKMFLFPPAPPVEETKEN